MEVIQVNETMLIGQTVRELRLAKKLKQEELAVLSGLKRLTISQIENDRRGVSPKNLRQLAIALEVPASFLHLLSDNSDDPLVKKFQIVVRETLNLPAREPAPLRSRIRKKTQS